LQHLSRNLTWTQVTTFFMNNISNGVILNLASHDFFGSNFHSCPKRRILWGRSSDRWIHPISAQTVV
jgi:hypothetical protein